MKDKKTKITSGPAVKIIVVLLFVVVYMAAQKYSSQGTIDDQIAREKDRNRILREKTIKGRILVEKELLEKLKEGQREIRIKTQEYDRLASEVDQIIRDNNIDYLEYMMHRNEIAERFFKESGKTCENKMDTGLKDGNTADKEPDISTVDQPVDKNKQLKELKKENRELSIAAFEETVLLNVKSKREKEIQNMESERDSLIRSSFDPRYDWDEEILDLKRKLEILKLMPVKDKQENSDGKGSKKTGELKD